MSTDTRIPGDPTSISSAARWLSGDLHDAVDHAADTLREARPTGGWEGRAADAFGGWSERSAETTDKVARRVERAGTELQGYAVALRRAQELMQRLRAEARAAGLQVDGTVVVDPGPGPADPGRLPAARPGLKIPLATVTRHADLVAAHEAHAALVRAYREVVREAQEVREELQESVDVLQAGYDALKSLGWITHGLGILTGALAVAAEEPVQPGWGGVPLPVVGDGLLGAAGAEPGAGAAAGGQVGWAGGVEAVKMPTAEDLARSSDRTR